MAVNNNFYATLNELFARATAGTISAVVDYATFVDAGKVLADMDDTDLTNGFLTPLMNKVQKTLMDTPTYSGDFADMYSGTLDYGVLEIIMGDFYNAAASVHDGSTISTGTTYTDQFKVNLPKGSARYYTESDSWRYTVTIRMTDLRGAFASPTAMDGFIRHIFLDIANSAEFHKENARRGVIASIIKECAGTTKNDSDEDAPAMYYNLLKIYNTKKGTTLKVANCLYNNDFVSWVCGVIRDVSGLIEKPSDQFNVVGSITTFTPADYQKLTVNSVFDKAIRRSLIDAYNPEYGMLPANAEIVPYWQNISDRMRVTTNETGEDTAYSPYVLALLRDKRACGEMVQIEKVATDVNGMYQYTNYHYLYNNMYWTNHNANTVIFCIEDEPEVIS